LPLTCSGLDRSDFLNFGKCFNKFQIVLTFSQVT